MAGLRFSLPYNDSDETLKELFTLDGTGGNRISEIYLSCPQEISGSGRITPRVTMDNFIETMKLIHQNSIRVNLVLNSTCQGADWYSDKAIGSILGFLERMYSDYAIEAVTIANPIYIKLVKQHIPRLEVCASVLSDVDCVQKALILRQAGADTITPDASINRDLELLKDIKTATGAAIKIMVNEGCLYRCPFRKFHFNYVSHWSKELDHSTMKSRDFFYNCMAVTSQDHSQILKSGWIRPENMGKYSDITDYFKIVGRTRPGSAVIRAVKAYMRQRYEGDLLDIICSSLSAFTMTYGASLDNRLLGESGFFDRVTSCDKKCHKCNYCNTVADRLIKMNVVTSEKLEDLGYRKHADKQENPCRACSE
jgi:collagenase-like PrtC family protease